MKLSLIQHLVCPQCGTKMYIEGGHRGARDFVRGTLLCLGNAHKYEIDRGVPVLIPPGTF